MQLNRPILRIFFPFVFGLFLFYGLLLKLDLQGSTFQFLALSSLTFLFLLLLFLFLIKRKSGIFDSLAWILCGVTIGAFNEPQFRENHFAKFESKAFEARVLEISKSQNKESKFYRCLLEIDQIHQQDSKKTTSGAVLSYIDTAISSKLQAGNRILFLTQPEPIRNSGNPGEFDMQLFWKAKGFEHQVFLSEAEIIDTRHRLPSVFESLRAAITRNLSQHLSGEHLAVALAILLGDKSYLNMELKDAFSGAGAMHLLAVSGLHVGIFLVILEFLFKYLGRRVPRWLRFLSIVAILWIYAGITGFSPSVNRAVTMFSFVALGAVLSRGYNPMDGLFASALLLLFVNPMFIFDIGFQLSYLAMIGIFSFVPVLMNAFYIKAKWLRFIWSGTTVALAAQLTTFPLTLYYFHQFPNYFLLTNLGLMLISSAIMALGLGLVTFGSIPFLSSVVAIAFAFILAALISFIQWVSELPAALSTGFNIQIYELLLFYLSVFLLIQGFYRRRKKLLIGSAVLFVFSFGNLTYTKYNRFTSEELIVLNTNDPTFLIRRGDDLDLIVFSNNKNVKEKSAFLKKSIDVSFGSNAKLHFCEKKSNSKIHSPELGLSMEVKPGQIHVANNEIKITYLFGNYFNPEEINPESIIVYGPWVTPESTPQKMFTKNNLELKKSGSARFSL